MCSARLHARSLSGAILSIKPETHTLPLDADVTTDAREADQVLGDPDRSKCESAAVRVTSVRRFSADFVRRRRLCCSSVRFLVGVTLCLADICRITGFLTGGRCASPSIAASVPLSSLWALRFITFTHWSPPRKSLKLFDGCTLGLTTAVLTRGGCVEVFCFCCDVTVKGLPVMSRDCCSSLECRSSRVSIKVVRGFVVDFESSNQLLIDCFGL